LRSSKSPTVKEESPIEPPSEKGKNDSFCGPL
jgi:hypothetical protein